MAEEEDGPRRRRRTAEEDEEGRGRKKRRSSGSADGEETKEMSDVMRRRDVPNRMSDREADRDCGGCCC